MSSPSPRRNRGLAVEISRLQQRRTKEPNEFVREIHTRMPVILPEEHNDSWLSEETGKEI
jgi:hypothetical protein